MRFDSISTVPLWYSRWFLPQVPLASESTATSKPFQWEAIEPSETFQWSPCYNDFQCARLQVPMDWQGTSDEANKTVEIAVVKLEATVPITDSNYGGAVVFNPGGPGGSGVSQVLSSGHSYRTVLSAGPSSDNSTAQYFDIIGFDPRGVNNTSPYFTCFPDHLTAASYAIEESVTGWVDTSSTSFDNLWAMKRAVAQGCSKRGIKLGIAKHMSTAAVARDIIEIFERHGQWRDKEAQQLLKTRPGNDLSAEERTSVLDRTAYRAGREMVQYWGFSYGTLLGGTLAAMFPDRIKRMILDGVVDFPDYMAAGWATNLRDTDRQLGLFGEYCYNGGPDNCAMYDSDGPTAIVGNVQKILSALEHNPIAVPGNAVNASMFVTYNDFQSLIWRGIVYNPLPQFTATAQILFELKNGNGTTLAVLKRKQRAIPKEGLSSQCQEDGPYSNSCVRPHLNSGSDAASTAGIACSDGLPRTHETKEEFRQYASKLSAQSELIGGGWATIMMPCTAWSARPHWRYDGDFKSKTAHPVLFIGNTVDPVTPLYNAFKMVEYFEGAAVLHQNSEGHCSTAAPSMCTGRALRLYFQNGTLPGSDGELDNWSGKGAFCEPDLLPLTGYGIHSPNPPLPKGETDQKLWEALVQLNLAGVEM